MLLRVNLSITTGAASVHAQPRNETRKCLSTTSGVDRGHASTNAGSQQSSSGISSTRLQVWFLRVATVRAVKFNVTGECCEFPRLNP
jgi:hypothetical protein